MVLSAWKLGTNNSIITLLPLPGAPPAPSFPKLVIWGLFLALHSPFHSCVHGMKRFHFTLMFRNPVLHSVSKEYILLVKAVRNDVTFSGVKFKCLLITSQQLGFPWWLRSKESTCNAGDRGDTGLIPESGRSPGGGHGNPLQYSCLKNPVDWKSLAGYSP